MMMTPPTTHASGPLAHDAEAFRSCAWAWLSNHGAEPRSSRPAEPPSTPARSAAVVHEHLRGVLEAILFASESPMTVAELARAAKSDRKTVKGVLDELVGFYRDRGFRIDEVA